MDNQKKFNEIIKNHGVVLPAKGKSLEIFNTFNTKSPTIHLFFRDIKRAFKKKEFMRSGVCEYLKTRKYDSMWDKHHEEIITLHLTDHDVKIIRKYTYPNMGVRKYLETDTIEILS